MRFQSLMTQLVQKAHGIRLWGISYHPYFVATDLATLLLFAFALGQTRVPISFASYAAAVLSALVVHRLALPLKARVLGTSSRSLLQDAIVILLPVYLGVHLLCGNRVTDALDLAAYSFALYFCIVRLGCFFGGCCYGIPSQRFGILYPPEVFQKRDFRFRKFTSGARVQTPVIPTQLYESAFHGSLFVGLYVLPVTPGQVLPLYFAAYGSFRFILDFWRRSSARPRRGG